MIDDDKHIYNFFIILLPVVNLMKKLEDYWKIYFTFTKVYSTSISPPDYVAWVTKD